ncbi:hypothetical protein ACEYYA_06910 [Paracoccus sp. p3-h83]|uniref:hypothetical protein n=1 Tax=Paracoccus sp. p3-h83 TaxID=3342805 RepID=UPI0035BA24BF
MRRRVFYIPGYDPIPPRRYRELYRKEGADQAAISGYELTTAPWKPPAGGFGWRARTLTEGQPAEAEIEVLVWSDIVQGSMGRSILATYGQLLRTSWAYIGSGALFRLMRLRRGPVIAALYPIVALVVQLLLALGLGALLVWGASLLGLPLWAGLPFGAGLTWAVLRWFQAHDGRFFAYYLMHDYAYSARWLGATPPDLAARQRDFADRIHAALTDPTYDEVLVVGHSSGVHIGVEVLADLTARLGVPDAARLGFLPLGQVVPMVSFLPQARSLRRHLADLSRRRDLTWIDVTAPGDGAAFALCDPVAVTGVAPPDQCWPLILSAAYSQTLSPARQAAIKWRFFRRHIQYLCAFDRPDWYDYFQITAGPLTLAERFADRAPSKSRKTRAVNRHRSMT